MVALFVKTTVRQSVYSIPLRYGQLCNRNLRIYVQSTVLPIQSQSVGTSRFAGPLITRAKIVLIVHGIRFSSFEIALGYLYAQLYHFYSVLTDPCNFSPNMIHLKASAITHTSTYLARFVSQSFDFGIMNEWPSGLGYRLALLIFSVPY